MAQSSQFQSSRDFTKTITIAVGQTESEAFDCYGASLVGFITDANLTGTTITFKGSSALDGTYLPYYTNDSAGVQKQISMGVSTSKIFSFNAGDFAGLQFIKFVSGATQITNQTIITLILRGTPA